MDTIKIKSGATKMIAHRGLSGIELENTNAAFVAAGNRSYFGIETDIHRTFDGKYIVIHDGNTSRVSGVEMDVEKSNFADLRALRLPDKNGRIRSDLCLPTPQEYLGIAKTYSKVAVLEIKERMDSEDIAKVLEIVKAEYSLENVIFISFELSNLICLRELCNEAKIQYLCYGEVTRELVDTVCKYGFGLDHHYRDLKHEDILYLHERGIEVNCWTVDDPAAAEELVQWGVDYITTNILE